MQERLRRIAWTLFATCAFLFLSLPSVSAQSEGDDFGGIDLGEAEDSSGLSGAQVKFLLGMILTTVLAFLLVARLPGTAVSVSIVIGFAIGVAFFIGLLPLWYAVLVWFACAVVVLRQFQGAVTSD